MINLLRINIGLSNENTKKYILKTKYKINDIYIDPFGSTKMRFHYPSLFSFNIQQINDVNNNNEEEFIYEIIISRKNKNHDLSNSKYFPKIGWNVDLSISCKINEFQLNEEFILNYIPQNYGIVQISNIISNINKFKVGIVIPTFGRLEYLKKCFNSLKKCNLNNCIIVIIDESMTKNIDNDKIETNKFIKDFDFQIPTIKIYKNVHGNMFDSINLGLDILGNFCDFLMNLDSDTIHDENFILKTIQTYQTIKSNENEHKVILISGFNTSKHKIITKENEKENENLNYYIKETIGGCHLCFNVDDYWNHIRYTLISYKWDTNIYNLINRIGGIIATTKPSVIEHIGEVSSVRDDRIIYDKSIDFECYNNNIVINKIYEKKFYLISENLKFENNQTWIIDVFKNEFIKYSNLLFTDNPDDADIIWIIGTNDEQIDKLKSINLENKQVITTIHHIDWDKIDNFNKNFDKIKNITTKYHVICDKVYYDLKKITNKQIVISNFWINENMYFPIENKKELREKYKIQYDSYCIGSFQRDTEGKNKCMLPKLSKGPDIFISIAIDLKKKYENLLVILSGRRRNYIINELQKNKINYMYFQMIDSVELNELYNCLDLYIVSSRVEGGPRAIIECAISKVPIISTDVGIAKLILDESSIYDMNDSKTYSLAKPNTIYAYEKSHTYSIINYMNKFIENVFN